MHISLGSQTSTWCLVKGLQSVLCSWERAAGPGSGGTHNKGLGLCSPAVGVRERECVCVWEEVRDSWVTHSALPSALRSPPFQPRHEGCRGGDPGGRQATQEATAASEQKRTGLDKGSGRGSRSRADWGAGAVTAVGVGGVWFQVPDTPSARFLTVSYPESPKAALSSLKHTCVSRAPEDH